MTLIMSVLIGLNIGMALTSDSWSFKVFVAILVWFYFGGI